MYIITLPSTSRSCGVAKYANQIWK